MANEIVAPYDTGFNLYVRIFNTSGQAWNGSAFETWDDDNVGDYDVALTDKSSGQYIGTFPSDIDAGTYKMVGFLRAGASPATTDAWVGQGTMKWDGTKEIPLAYKDDLLKVLNVIDES